MAIDKYQHLPHPEFVAEATTLNHGGYEMQKTYEFDGIEAELNAQVVMPGYTRGDLSAAFKLVQNKEHWKLEIDQHGIPADKLEAVIFAIEFFTGSLATAEYDGLTEAGGATFRVKAAGYYQTIGA